MKIPSNVLTFAGGNADMLDLMAGFQDYWNQYRSGLNVKDRYYKGNLTFDTSMSFDEKENKLNKAMIKEIVRLSGLPIADMPVEQWFNAPTVTWATFAVVNAMIDMILPNTVIDTIGAYTDVRTGGFGDSFSFDVKPRDLFPVSKAGRAQKVSEMRQEFQGQVTVTCENRMITIGASLYRILAGKASLADLVAKAVRSIETQMAYDCYSLFYTTTIALSSTADSGLQQTGFSQAKLVSLANRVEAWNQGAKPLIVGTQLALVNVLPDDSNYRYQLSDPFMTVGYVPTAFGYDVLKIPQVADYSSPFKANLISDSYLWLISPSSQKLLKLCLEGNTLSYSTGVYENSNLLQETVIQKAWGVAVGSNAICGIISI
jgi:hypothetical protein